MIANPCKLEAVNIRKEYPGTVALEDVSVKFEGGKVHALIGKNGAGKSTLVKILAGSEQSTSGRIIADGTEITLNSPMDAFAKGIAIVYQELSLVPGLTVAENILLSRMPKRKGFGGLIIDWSQSYSRAETVLADMQVQMDVRMPVGELGMAQQQIVEVAKAMSFNPSVLMLDEPTSALARHETASLFSLIRKLAKRGVAIIYISHRLQELREIADQITVLRDGKHIGTVEMLETKPEEIVHMMFGETVPRERPYDVATGDRPVMEVRGLSRGDKFKDVSFTLYEGEVLGIAGMLGSGRTELLKAIFGAEPFDNGEINIRGRSILSTSPPLMKKLGLAFTPENRKENALVQAHSIRANMCMAGMEKIGPKGFITKVREQVVVDEYIEKLNIKVSDTEDPVSSLSGGNQQKVVLGNWLGTRPRIILFDEPTRGIDVHAKQQMFQIIWDLSREGISSVFVSTELEELVEICHRILIMKCGRIEKEVRPREITADELFVMCMEE